MNEERSNRDNRPSPDALLQQAAKESRGRLKIFLGAAPGVGKTYEMLTTAQAKRREGVDVVVGVAETHGRKETEALLDGLEVISRQLIEYKGHHLREMDIDAILTRRPKLALVDELAHTNAPGCRHPKRYLDVEELLDAGIDVYATLNIQHVESLNDVVAKITGVRVRETVPDSIIDRADEVEVVDLTPEDLAQRLKEGKVYLPQQAERAMGNYFKPGNLTALRELALRRTAQRVDEQMVDYMRAHAISGPWAAGERVLVGVNEDPGCLALVRYTRRLADRLRAPWTAVHIETSKIQRLDEAARDRIAEALRLAERLGGEAVTIPGTSVAEELVAYGRANNCTHIIITSSRRSWLAELLQGSTTHEIIRQAGEISVHVIAGQAVARLESKMGGEAASAETTAPMRRRSSFELSAYAGTLAMVTVALGVSLILQRYLGISVIALVFLTAVLTSAITYGLWPALAASLVSTLAYNFFFLPPLYNFTISDPQNVVALFFFAIVALIASNLTARMRSQALAARQRAKTNEDLYLFSRKLGGAVTLDDLLWATSYQIALMLKVTVVILLPEEGTVAVRGGYPPEDTLDEADLAAAKWCWQNDREAGRGADTLPGAKRLFLPIRTGRGPVGVVGLASEREGSLLSPDQRRLLDALCDQAALAIERTTLAHDLDNARLVAETDRLRSALLTSISHDLKTPLASILGAITSLRTYSKAYDEAAKEQLMGTVQEEAERLNRFIANLLDMTRLESGAVAPGLTLVDLSEVVGSALKRTAPILAEHKVAMNLAPDLPMLRLDFVLFEQVLFNLLDNAAKYAPAGSTVELRGTRAADRVILQVLDEGEGIPPADVERVFDKFYRVHGTDRRRAGTGLGLAICRGFVEAMGGTIRAGNRPDRTGAVFTIEMPVPEGAEPSSASDIPSVELS
ncbi:MAG TPA: sensor histidine kinase KdpD [Verrucomicrobiae bacterium]|nr:sensor histidine kinase KdpD [Verrucomicrobiae bacterium]